MSVSSPECVISGNTPAPRPASEIEWASELAPCRFYLWFCALTNFRMSSCEGLLRVRNTLAWNTLVFIVWCSLFVRRLPFKDATDDSAHGGGAEQHSIIRYCGNSARGTTALRGIVTALRRVSLCVERRSSSSVAISRRTVPWYVATTSSATLHILNALAENIFEFYF